MAIQNDGPNGHFTGKVGSVYGYVLNGQNIIRGARRPSSKKPTEAVLLNRKKIKVAAQFLSHLTPIVRYGYKNIAPKGSRVGPVQLAQSHIFKECIELDENNNPFVNPQKVLLFRGALATPTGGRMDREEGLITIYWDVNPQYTNEFYKIHIVLYDVEGEVGFLPAEAKASAGVCVVNHPILQRTTNPLHVCIAFTNVYEETFSDSVYLGVL